MLLPLYPFQERMYQEARAAVMDGHDRILLQADTGAGKTQLAMHMLKNMAERGRRGVFMVHSRAIIRDVARRFEKAGLPFGIFVSGYRPKESEPIQLCSKDTLVARCVRGNKHFASSLPEADLVIVDECHRSMAKTYQRLLSFYEPRAITKIGLSGTPALTDGRGMGSYWKKLICGPPTSELIKMNAIVPCKIFAPDRPDYKGLRFAKDGSAGSEGERRINKPKLVGNIVKHWLDYGENRPTICFASGVNHSMALRDAFVKEGIPAIHVDQGTNDKDREECWERTATGENQIICNVGVGLEGIDIVELGCCIWARVTKSLIQYRQGIGRIKRPAPDKHYAIVLDHAGAWEWLGKPDDDIEWTLEETDKPANKSHERREKEGKPLLVCPKCFFQFGGTNICPECGHQLSRQGKQIVTEAGQLVDVTAIKRREDGDVDTLHTQNELRRKWDYYRALAVNMGRKGRMAAVMFNKEIGQWPDQAGMPGCVVGTHWDRPAAELWPTFTPQGRAALKLAREMDTFSEAA